MPADRTRLVGGRAVPSRRCTNDWNNVPLKQHAPIASAAALSERHAHPRITERPRRPHAPCRGAACRSRRNAADSNGPPLKWQRLPDLSLRGRFAPVAISGRQLRFRRGFPVIHPGTARFPRRFAPRNGNSDSLAPPNHHCNTRNCRRRSLSAATDAIGWYVLIGSLQTASAFPRSPRPLWGLAMTRQGSAVVRR